jgi:hypothetical protein
MKKEQSSLMNKAKNDLKTIFNERGIDSSMIKNRIPINAILNALMLEAMNQEACFDFKIKYFIDELRTTKRIDSKHEEELKSFFLIREDKISKEAYTREDFEFFTRKLFSLYDIPNTEKIKLIYYGIKSNKFDEETAKDLLKDFDLVSYHNELIIEFEKILK